MLLDHPFFADAKLATLLLISGLLIGLAFGAIAQISRFCLRSGLIQAHDERDFSMLSSYLTALLVAALGTQALITWGGLSLDGTRFAAGTLALGPLLVGGVLFGAGMVLTRGCPSRLTVLTGQGNLRALLVLVVFGITATATLRGALAASRRSFADLTTIDIGPSALPVWAGVALLLGALLLALRPRISPRAIATGVGIGLCVVAGWAATGVLFSDAFAPQPADSIAFTAGASDTVFYIMVSTALEPGFTVGIIGGVILGAFVAALLRGSFRVEGFESTEQTGRYILGAVFMGIGGVWAGGCTIGAGLTGGATFSIAALLALASIALGAVLMHARLTRVHPVAA